jgi:two-component system sensor histidine kinase CpxA
MRPGKLYIKISLSFLAVLFITLIVIFALFIVSPGKHFTTRLEEHTKTKVLIVKEAVEGKIRSAPTADLSKNEQLKEFIINFGSILGAKVWLQRPDGTVCLKSFSDEIPELVEKFKKRRSREWRTRDYGSFNLHRRRHSDFYAVIPIAFPEGEKGSIHILFGIQEPPSPERGFALGLAIIGLIIALLIIPISRFIIKPLKALNQSALQIADGDLSHRAVVKSKDEIGELCHSFNHMADKLEKMIKGGKELTANVSHELRTPLTRIRIAEELLREKLEHGDIKEYARYLDDIREDISELDSLIGRILELSKLDIYESPLRFETINPLDLINDLLERLKPVIESKDLHATTDLSFHPPFKGDEKSLRTALINILDNAAKFAPAKRDFIIRMQSEHKFLEISVINSFKAISEDDLAKIFDPFYRTEKTSETGSGLGLAIAKKIIERHGGNIKAFNSPEGLEIRMRLPTEPSEKFLNKVGVNQ